MTAEVVPKGRVMFTPGGACILGSSLESFIPGFLLKNLSIAVTSALLRGGKFKLELSGGLYLERSFTSQSKGRESLLEVMRLGKNCRSSLLKFPAGLGGPRYGVSGFHVSEGL
jgi:hypothetical protein